MERGQYPIVEPEAHVPMVTQQTPQQQVFPPLGGPVPALEALSENDIKVMLDGDRIRVSAYVDIKGAKRLMKALKANMELLEDDDEAAN